MAELQKYPVLSQLNALAICHVSVLAPLKLRPYGAIQICLLLLLLLVTRRDVERSRRPPSRNPERSPASEGKGGILYFAIHSQINLEKYLNYFLKVIYIL